VDDRDVGLGGRGFNDSEFVGLCCGGISGTGGAGDAVDGLLRRPNDRAKFIDREDRREKDRDRSAGG
jgi:hypothetical protein